MSEFEKQVDALLTTITELLTARNWRLGTAESNLPHSAVAIEDTLDVGVFNPLSCELRLFLAHLVASEKYVLFDTLH